MLCKKSLKTKMNLVKSFKSFEYMDIVLESNSKSLRVVVVSRPPPSMYLYFWLFFLFMICFLTHENLS